MGLVSAHASERFKWVATELVKELGSQAAVARRLGVSTAYLSRLLRGEIDQIRDQTIRQAERALDLEAGMFESDLLFPPTNVMARPEAERQEIARAKMMRAVAERLVTPDTELIEAAENVLEMPTQATQAQVERLAELTAKMFGDVVQRAHEIRARVQTEGLEAPGVQLDAVALAIAVLSKLGATPRTQMRRARASKATRK